MNITIRRSFKLFMSEPFLDFLHASSVLAKYTSGSLSCLTKSDLFQIVLLQDPLEVSAHTIGII